MGCDSLKFTMYDLLLGFKRVEKKDFQNIQDKYVFTDGDAASGIAWFENTSNYLWMYACSGENYPYSTDVIDVKTKELQSNPRKPDQAELRRQEFCLYNYDSKLFYASGSLDFFKRMLSEVNPNVKCRHIYKTREEFINSLKKIKSVRFVAEENLLTHNENLFAFPKDVLGLGNPKQIRVEYKFPYVNVTERFKSCVKKFFNDYDVGKLKSLVVAGGYEEGDQLIASTFNLKNLVPTISVNIERNSSGMFDPKSVKDALLVSIR